MKIYTQVDHLNQALKEKKRQTIVFTNGCFDILHPGHIEILEFSRNAGDCLIVGVNDDASIQRLKGKGRPFLPLEERQEILAAITHVSYVIPFSEDTPLELIQSLYRVDVLVKGGDYQNKTVVGQEHVESHGGKVLLFQFKSNYSSSHYIDRLKS